MKTTRKTFSQVILLLMSFIFFVVGILLLFFTEQVSLIALNGTIGRLTIVIQQFLGNTYLLLGCMLYVLKDSKGRPLFVVLTSTFFMGCINLYLIFQFNDLIVLPSIYFILQLLGQLIILFALIDERKKIK
tara:strand:- start:34 stop:426 length:393 start_codon:yes stop_codon:yes gene_type:complete